MSTSNLLGKKMLLATDGSEEAELATRAAPSSWQRAAAPNCTWSMSSRCPTS